MDPPTSDLPEMPGSSTSGDARVTERLEALAAAARESYERTGAIAGQSIGPYKLLSLLGEGGFGEVWLAERREPFVQRVAVKLIKPGMDSRAVLGRFEQERQALAVMDHPSIARVLDGGVSESGRPYFVMEHVQGESITTFCDRHTYTVKQRLDLFVQVCEAVQHAHHKGIIHRDLKPSNILVMLKDDHAIAKVIDFGVAKAISQTLTERTIFTEQGRFIGTPEYMSPEQAEMGAVDIDTRTDVYSLGVVLYELLAGVLPFDPRELRAQGYDAIRRIIREQDPPKPSTRLTSLDDESATAVANKRESHREQLSRELRRELDWIPLKAMRKDRTERYRTPSELAADIRRYLEGEPLEAGPESAAYRIRKFIKRNRRPAAAAGIVAAALVAAAAVSVWFAMAASAERDRAVAAEGEARRRAHEVERVSHFQAGMLDQVDPSEAGLLLTRDVLSLLRDAMTDAGASPEDIERASEVFGEHWARINTTDAARRLIDRTILAPSVATIDKEFKDRPLLAAQLRQVLATRYRELGLPDRSEPLQQQALETRRRLLGDTDPETLNSKLNMSNLLLDQGRLEAARSMADEVRQDAERLLGPDHLITLDAINLQGLVANKDGRLDEAESLHIESLTRRERRLGAEHPRVITAVANLGVLLRARGTLKEAEPYYVRALELSRRVHGPDHPATLNTLRNLGVLHRAMDRLPDAERCHRDALDGWRRLYGEEHPQTLRTMNALALALKDQGKFDEADALYTRALEGHRRVFGPDHQSTIMVIANLGMLKLTQRKLDEAEPLLREAVERRTRTLSPDHPETVQAVNNLGGLFKVRGRLPEAEQQFRAALEARRRVLTDQHPDTLQSMVNLGILLREQGKLEESERLLRDAAAKYPSALSDSHLLTLNAQMEFAMVLIASGKGCEAAEVLVPREATAARVLVGPRAHQMAKFKMRLGLARAGCGQTAAAEADLLNAYERFTDARGGSHAETRACGEAIADLHDRLEKSEPGRGHAAEAAKWRERVAAAPHPTEP